MGRGWGEGAGGPSGHDLQAWPAGLPFPGQAEEGEKVCARVVHVCVRVVHMCAELHFVPMDGAWGVREAGKPGIQIWQFGAPEAGRGVGEERFQSPGPGDGVTVVRKRETAMENGGWLSWGHSAWLLAGGVGAPKGISMTCKVIRAGSRRAALGGWQRCRPQAPPRIPSLLSPRRNMGPSTPGS